MHVLLKDDDTCIEDEEEILTKVSRFYNKLFQSVGERLKVLEARHKLLQHMTVRVTEAQWEEIEQTPTIEELRKTMLALPKGKSPSLDGLTLEVLLALWSFIQAECVAMVRHFWTTRVLPHNTTVGVMKAIPKKENKWRLKDWRPLTMLTIVYMLIAKLLSTHFSPHNWLLIDPQ